MPVHPIESRYSYPSMYSLFTEERRLHLMLKVEAALAQVQADLGVVPGHAARQIAGGTEKVTLHRVREVEERIGHDVMAMVQALSEASGDGGRYVHLGATSADIVDTTWGLILKEACGIIEADLQALQGVLVELCEKYKATPMMGRTHGQHALPITFGFKAALWLDEIHRHVLRLRELKPRLLVGKMSGAVGSFAGLGSSQVQGLLMARLGLGEPLIASQVISRDRIAEFVLWLALVAGTMDKIFREVRNLARTEIKELEEPFKPEQVGSSTMPQKRNPRKSERICGLARVIKSYAFPALEDISLEHERDLTNSSVERTILPEACLLTDYILRQAAEILSGLRVYPENMQRNMAISMGLTGSEALMLKLTERGLGRQEAHALVRQAAWRATDERRDFVSMLREMKIFDYLTEEEVKEALDPYRYLGECVAITEQVIQQTARES
ncbi:MAG: adenylosuccinate lyase [Chloroflexota bacterium]